MKPSTAKAKGRDTENRFVEWARAHGLPNVERRRLSGTEDQGDIAGWPGVCVEVKSGARVDISTWLAELAVEVDHSGADVGFVVARPPSKPQADDWYCVLPLPSLWQLLTDAGWVPKQGGPVR